MERIYFNDEVDVERYKDRIESGRVDAWCAKCQQRAEVLRARGEPDGPIYRIACPLEDQNLKHFMVTFHLALPEMDQLMGHVAAKH